MHVSFFCLDNARTSPLLSSHSVQSPESLGEKQQMANQIEFLLESPEVQRFVYRPYGVRSLKVLVKTTKGANLRLRPSGMDADERKNGIFRGLAGEGGVFEMSWGGGHEEGPCLQAEDFWVAFERCVELQPGQQSLLYFNLRHKGGHFPKEQEIALEAYDPESGRVAAVLPITLVRPVGLDPETAVHFVQQSDRWQPVGKMLPTYDSRWWPDDFQYQPAGELPIHIIQKENMLAVHWNGQEITRITDHTSPSILNKEAMQMELFHFDQWHLALRVWFFWLDRNIGGGLFFGQHEVPDAERFDFLIRRRDGRVTQACTDLHWREVWGFSTDENTPVQATLGTGGLSREDKLKLVVEKLVGHGSEPDHPGVHNPLETVQLTSEMFFGEELVKDVRAKGTEAHLPMLHNVAQTEEKPSLMVSSDVRRG